MPPQPPQRPCRRLTRGVGTGMAGARGQIAETERLDDAANHDPAIAGTQLPQGVPGSLPPLVSDQSFKGRTSSRTQRVGIDGRPPRRQPPGVARTVDDGAMQIASQRPVVRKMQRRPPAQNPHDDVLNHIVWIEAAGSRREMMPRHTSEKGVVPVKRLGRESRSDVHDVCMDGHILWLSGWMRVATRGKGRQKAARAKMTARWTSTPKATRTCAL